MRLIVLTTCVCLLAACSHPAPTPPPPTVEQSAAPTDTCAGFADALAACTTYSCTFVHPFTGESLLRKIAPKEDGCHYTEQLPQSGEMRCTLSTDMQEELAQFYQRTLGKAYEAQAAVDINTGESRSVIVVDGVTYPNSLQTAIDNADCVLSQ